MDSLLSGWVSPVLAQITVFVLAILVIRLRPGGLFPSRGRGHEEGKLFILCGNCGCRVCRSGIGADS
jgi:hypothetical protein